MAPPESQKVWWRSGKRSAFDAYQKQLLHDASNQKPTYILERVEGTEEGIELGKETVAINLIKADLMTNEQIAQVTGLRVEQITQLRESLESDDE